MFIDLTEDEEATTRAALELYLAVSSGNWQRIWDVAKRHNDISLPRDADAEQMLDELAWRLHIRMPSRITRDTPEDNKDPRFFVAEQLLRRLQE